MITRFSKLPPCTCMQRGQLDADVQERLTAHQHSADGSWAHHMAVPGGGDQAGWLADGDDKVVLVQHLGCVRPAVVRDRAWLHVSRQQGLLCSMKTLHRHADMLCSTDLTCARHTLGE